jgi:hypothetical protein
MTPITIFARSRVLNLRRGVWQRGDTGRTLSLVRAQTTQHSRTAKQPWGVLQERMQRLRVLDAR